MRDVKVVIARRTAIALAVSVMLVACGRSENSTTITPADAKSVSA